MWHGGWRAPQPGRVVGASHGLTALAYAVMALTPPGWSGWALLAAPLGGLLADAIGTRPTMWIVAAGMAVVALRIR